MQRSVRLGEFSFEVPDNLKGDAQARGPNNPPPEDFEFSPKEQKDINQTLNRIAQTPDGKELIRDAFKDSNADKIHILDGSKHDLGTSALKTKPNPSIILNNSDNATGRYLGDDGQPHNSTKEQILAHELCHHTKDVGKDEYAAIACENEVMENFEGHVPRASHRGDGLGTRQFERAGPILQQESSLSTSPSSNSFAQTTAASETGTVGFETNDNSVRFTGDPTLLADAQRAGIDVPPHIAAQAQYNNTILAAAPAVPQMRI